jgi:hypothetical protein
MMLDREHSLTTEDVDAIERRLRHLSLSLLPQLVERDLPRLLNEVRSLHAILFMKNFTTSLHNGVNANETETNPIQGEDPPSPDAAQAGERDRTSSEDTASQPDAGVQDPAGVRPGRATNKRRNKKRRRRNK